MSSRKEKKRRNRRERQVRGFRKVLPPLESLKALGDPRKLPLLDFAGAAALYVNGSYNTCILQSTFSAETALLLKLDKKLSEEEKEEIKKKMGFSSVEPLI